MKKRTIAFAAAAVMMCSLPVMAAESPSASAVMASVAEAAASESKSVGEYTNNAVVAVSGLDEVTPIGQGGHVVINGAPSNVIFFLTKPSAKTVTLAKAQAEVLGGKVLNVVGTKSQAVGKFETAQVNFYAKGVKAGQLIRVYQLIDGEWVELEVAEIWDDHVVVNMTAHGILAFIEVPATAETPKATGTPAGAAVEAPKAEAAVNSEAEVTETPKARATETSDAEAAETPKAAGTSEKEAAETSKAKAAETPKVTETLKAKVAEARSAKATETPAAEDAD